MSDLSAKFAALEQILISQHASMMVVLNAISGKLDALRGDGPENTLKSINQSIWNLAGPAPGVNLVQLRAAIEALEGGQDSIANILKVGLLYESSAVQPVLSTPEGVLRPDLWQLWQIASCVCRSAQLLGGTVTPNPTDSNGCASPWQSAGQLSADGMSLATWASPPAGVTITNSYQLTRTGGWAGWRAFVSSSANQAAFDTSSARFATNQWIAIPAAMDTLGFSVAGGAGLTVYLCGGASEAIELQSQQITITASGYSHTRYGVIWPVDWPTVNTASGFLHSPTNITTQNVAGYTVRRVSGGHVRVIWHDGTTHEANLAAVGDAMTIPGSPVSWCYVDNWYSNEVSPGDLFAVEITPPSS